MQRVGAHYAASHALPLIFDLNQNNKQGRTTNVSLSNPTANTPNPATKWFEWGGKAGELTIYDKVKKEEVIIPLPFAFILLDSTNTIRGYNKKMKTGIYSNEIRDTRSEPFVVKFFSGGSLANGLWADIKDTVVARSGKFAKNLYLAYKEGNELKLGALQATGCAMSAWFDFQKNNAEALTKNAVVMRPGKRDTSGDVAFTPPEYSLKPISEEMLAEAVVLDKKLQTYLDGYFRRTTVEKAHASAPAAPKSDEQPDGPPDDVQESHDEPPTEDDNVPF